MSYKTHPIRVKLSRESYDLLMGSLKTNEDIYTGFTSESAAALREKIEQYGRTETDENGDEVFNLHFFEKEGERFIMQFIASAKIIRDLLDENTENPI
jgi:hypothetical protein